MASLAGKGCALGMHLDYIEGSFYGYNDAMTPLIVDVLKSLQSYTVD